MLYHSGSSLSRARTDGVNIYAKGVVINNNTDSNDDTPSIRTKTPKDKFYTQFEMQQQIKERKQYFDSLKEDQMRFKKEIKYKAEIYRKKFTWRTLIANYQIGRLLDLVIAEKYQ